jgi:polyribonucleotide nucleotidyltransferase
MQEKVFAIDNLAGRPLKVKITALAEQANSSVIVQYGETTVLVTATMAKEDRDGLDYFPLIVDYEERFYAAGKILGSRFIRREGRPSEAAILSGRLIDRPIRPLFNQRMRRDVQVIVTVLSIDNDNDPDFAGLLGASAALGISDIPWNGPVSGIRIGKIGDKFLVNPTYTEREAGEFDIFASGTEDKINMLEISAKEVPEEIIIQALNLAQEEIKKLNQFQKEIFSQIGASKTLVELKEPNPEFQNKVREFLENKLEEAVHSGDKMTRQTKLDTLKKGMADWLKEKGIEEEKVHEAFLILEDAVDKMVHKNILKQNKRPDGRKLNELRPINCEVGVLPRVHGSAIFTRGNTQALSSITLAAPSHELTIETIETSGSKRFLHHYNFPPYSVGEIGPMRGPGRREIGHGALAEKSLFPIIPDKDQFPYTIRVVSEILSSNGSSSMASVCGSSLALMDAGVPIKTPAAGIAMGLMMENENNYKILTDIQGPEDHYGDMDLKAAGTKNGITGAQMDVKIQGVTIKILEEVLEQAKAARAQILEKMDAVLGAPRPNLSPLAPKIKIIKINPEQIGLVIGSGGKTIHAIMEKNKVEIDIDDDGSVFVTGLNENDVEAALKMIESITHEYKVGDIVEGAVSKILDFGAVVDLGPHKDGLLHISELAYRHVEKVEDIVKMGETIKVKVIRVDPDGRIGLSLKAMSPPPEASGSENIVYNRKTNFSRPNRRPPRPKNRF